MQIDIIDKTSKYKHALIAAVARPKDDSNRIHMLKTLLCHDTIPPAGYKSALQKGFRFYNKAVFKQVLAGIRNAAAKNVKKFPNIKGM